jgi:beta-glucanase (GH16 family)
LKWNDEFNTPGQQLPDATKWTHEIGIGPNNNGWDHNERQYYTDRLQNTEVSGGTLKIRALREDYRGSQFTSARIITRNKLEWTYGCMEVRAKLPVGSGTWSALWMLASQNVYGDWPASGEIDVIEHVGNFPDTVQVSAHTLRQNHRTSQSIFGKGCAPVAEWRVYSLCWQPDYLKGYLDADEIFSYQKEPNAQWDTWPFDQPFFAILNLAVGGAWGEAMHGMDWDAFNWPGQILEIDYVRLYE